MDETTMPGAEDEQAGYKICIVVDSQGALSVGVESEASADVGDGGSYAPVQSIDEALQMAKDIHANNGQMMGAMSPEDAAMKGYNKGGAPATSMGPAKVFGDE